MDCLSAGLHMPSRASSGALHRLSALRHLVRTQRPATKTSARNLQRLVTYGAYLLLAHFDCWIISRHLWHAHAEEGQCNGMHISYWVYLNLSIRRLRRMPSALRYLQ